LCIPVKRKEIGYRCRGDHKRKKQKRRKESNTYRDKKTKKGRVAGRETSTGRYCNVGKMKWQGTRDLTNQERPKTCRKGSVREKQ